MCGIAGCMRLRDGGDVIAEEEVRGMTDALWHRGPDAGDVWVDVAAGVALGHRRLAILDLSPEGAQPMMSACGRYRLVFNGEIYNFVELRAELEAGGATFRGHSDTEVMLAAIAAWGLRTALARFNGMFAFALWDRDERRLSLARDRLGKKPLYYGRYGGALLFGSEIKAVRRHPGFRDDFDHDALRGLFRRGYISAPRSVYSGLRKLPPGCLIEMRADVTGDLPDPEPYWRLDDAVTRGREVPFRGGDAVAIDALHEVLRRAVSMRFRSDVPLGAFLSGGIDSSLVVALMQESSDEPVRTFTVGFDNAAYDEAAAAAEVARRLGTRHHEIRLSPGDMLELVPSLPDVYDEPFADSSQIPTLLVSRFAREHVVVCQSGDGGDELFGGYNRHFLAARHWPRIARVPYPLRRPLSAGLGRIPSALWDRLLGSGTAHGHRNAAEKLRKALAAFGARDVEHMYTGLLSHGVPGGADWVLGAAPRPPRGTVDGLSPAAECMYLDTLGYLPDDILVKTDRASMSVALELRAPLLDVNVLEFAWSLPEDLKIRDGRGKWLMRRLLARYLPEAMFERPKMGFAVPLDAWLRGPLREWGEDLITGSGIEASGVLDRRRLHRAWDDHQKGRRTLGQSLWAVMMWQLWYRRWH